MLSASSCGQHFFLLLSCCCALLATPTLAAQILGLFAHPGKSHFDFFRPIFLNLAANGHNVSVYSYFPNKVPVPNYTDHVFEGMSIMTDMVDLKLFDDEEQSVPFKIPTFFMLHGWGMQACEIALNSPRIAELLATGRNVKYDVIIVEQFNNDCMLAVAHLLRAPVVALSSCAIMPWHYRRMGSPFVSSYMPMNFLPYTNDLDFVARVNNFLHFNVVDMLFNLITQPATDAIVRKRFGAAGIPPMRELVKRTSLMLINQHAALTGAHPYAPNVVEVGGLQIGAAKPLSKQLQAVLERSQQLGVIYISWGSMINPSTLPARKRQELFSCIAQLPRYTFVLRWSNETLPDKPANLHTLEWLPQRDLLCHPNVKAFMTHGGLLGTTEAVHCGVPMLVTPFYGDQFLNAVAIEKRRFGVIVKYKDFNAPTLLKALQDILTPSFTNQVKINSEAFRSRPQQPLALALWWIEHIIQTGGAPLAQSSAKELNWFIYNSIDVYLLLMALILLLIYFMRILCKLFAYVCCNRTATTATNKVKRQ